MLGEGPAGAFLVDACAQVPLDRTLARGDIDGDPGEAAAEVYAGRVSHRRYRLDLTLVSA
jgi:hypothetical protein